jgi:hypothetical protein
MIAVVSGMIATYPVGGVLWDYGQYALGLERLGFEVYYLEDTGGKTYDPRRREYGEDCSYGLDFLQRSLGNLSRSLGRRWRFRNMDGQTFGLDAEEFNEVVNTADIFLNVSGGTLLRNEYLPFRRKILIDSDPGWNHFRNYPRWDANPQWEGSHNYRAHDFFFTYAECIGSAECVLPTLGLKWHATRPPVVMDCWNSEPPNEKWTTVMTWKNFQETILHDGVLYGTKEMEFEKVEALPSRVNARFEVATGGAPVPKEKWESDGWTVVQAAAVSETPEDYRRYVQSSRGEFSIAKNVYVATRSGWFSCRSACYLAAGLPVVVQDTGFTDFIPTGEGLLAFSDLDEAVADIDTIEKDYDKHRRAARELACSHFSADVVLSDLLGRVGV